PDPHAGPLDGGETIEPELQVVKAWWKRGKAVLSPKVRRHRPRTGYGRSGQADGCARQRGAGVVMDGAEDGSRCLLAGGRRRNKHKEKKKKRPQRPRVGPFY